MKRLDVQAKLVAYTLQSELSKDTYNPYCTHASSQLPVLRFR